MKLLTEIAVFFVTMLIAFALVAGLQPVVDRIAPSWLAMAVTTFGAMLVIWIPAARASDAATAGARGAILGALATLFVLEPAVSGVVANLLGTLLGTLTALLYAARWEPQAAAAPPPIPPPATTCQLCGGAGEVGLRFRDGRMEQVRADQAATYEPRTTCPYCHGSGISATRWG